MSLIFISYSSKDSDVAIRIQAFFSYLFGLRSEEVFLAEHSIRAGAHGEERILDAIKTSDFQIFLLSENFFNSPYCMCELGATWSSHKTPYKFLMEPLTSKDNRYEGLPPYIRDTQYITIRGGDRAKVRQFINNIIEDIISRTNRGTLGPKNDLLLDIADFLSASPLSKKVIDLRSSSHFHHPADTKSTLSLKSGQDSIIMLVDYSMVKPQFAGGVIKLFGDNWTNEYKEGFSLYFNISATLPLSKVIVEIKDIDGIISTQELEVSNQKKQFHFCLQELNVQRRFEKMNELVFLVDPSDFDAISRIEISGVFIDR